MSSQALTLFVPHEDSSCLAPLVLLWCLHGGIGSVLRRAPMRSRMTRYGGQGGGLAVLGRGVYVTGVAMPVDGGDLAQ